MRWDNLFDDLESQLEHELSVDDVDLRAEEERLRLGRISLRDRIFALYENGTDAGQAARGTVAPALRIQLTGGITLAVHPQSFGKDWFAAHIVDELDRHTQCIVPLAAVTALLLDRRQMKRSLTVKPSEDHSLAARLGLTFALRDLCRRRASVELQLAHDIVHGTIDRVGRDHLDLAVHEPGSPRREHEVSHYRVVPFSAILLVRMQNVARVR